MLKTPLGEIQIFIDSNAVDYNFQKLNNYTDENEVQTWFGADPTLMNINYA